MNKFDPFDADNCRIYEINRWVTIEELLNQNV